jgi:hypothetical protein
MYSFQHNIHVIKCSYKIWGFCSSEASYCILSYDTMLPSEKWGPMFMAGKYAAYIMMVHFYPEDGGSIILWNDGTHLPHHIVSLSSITQYEWGGCFPDELLYVRLDTSLCYAPCLSGFSPFSAAVEFSFRVTAVSLERKWDLSLFPMLSGVVCVPSC